jgi:hypothetical protein
MKKQTGIGRRDLIDIKMRDRVGRKKEKINRQTSEHKYNKTAEIIWQPI